jgi:ABC-type Co2+ transport system permease subunit
MCIASSTPAVYMHTRILKIFFFLLLSYTIPLKHLTLSYILSFLQGFPLMPAMVLVGDHKQVRCFE